MKIKFILAFATLLVSTLFLSACGDDQEKNTKQAQRHLRTAATYLEQGQVRASLLEARNAIQLRPHDAEGYLTLSKIYSAMGAYQSTLKLLENRTGKLPELTPTLAQAYLDGNKPQSALESLNNYKLGDNPFYSQTDLLKLSALAYIQTKNSTRFSKTLEKLQKLEDTTSTDTLYLQAKHNLSQGNYTTGQEFLQKALLLEPKHFDSLILLGDVAYYLNQLENAEAAYSKALSTLKSTDIITANRVTVLNKLSETLVQQGHTSEAYVYQKLLADADPETHAAQQKFKLALSEYSQGELENARDILIELHEQFPSEKSSATLLGLIQFQLGNSEQAAYIFDQVIDPETATAPLLRAAALSKLKQNQGSEAVELLKTASEKQAKDPIILATYGLAALDMDATDSNAALALEKSLSLAPERQRLRLALAKHYRAIEQPQQAFAQLETAYLTKPLDLPILQAYFKALLKQDGPQKTLQAIKTFKKQHPAEPKALLLEGWYHLTQKNFALAETAFLQLTKNVDNKNFALPALAKTYTAQEKWSKAEEYWKETIIHNPSNSQAYSLLFMSLQKQGTLSSGYEFLKKLEQQQPAEWKPSSALAQLYTKQGQFEQALKHAHIAQSRSPNKARYKTELANIHHKHALSLRAKKDFPNARKSILAATELYPESISYLSVLIQTEIDFNNFTEAEKLTQQLPNTEAAQPAKLYLQGKILLQQHKTKQALEALYQAWSLSPNDTIAHVIFNAHNSAKEDKQARTFLSDWVTALPNSPKANLLSALNAQQQGHTAEAITAYEKTLSLAPNQPAALNNLAMIYLEQGDKRALETAHQAYVNAPNSPAILDTYGWALLKDGQTQKAREILKLAAKAAPDNHEITAHLTEANNTAL